MSFPNLMRFGQVNSEKWPAEKNETLHSQALLVVVRYSRKY